MLHQRPDGLDVDRRSLRLHLTRPPTLVPFEVPEFVKEIARPRASKASAESASRSRSHQSARRGDRG